MSFRGVYRVLDAWQRCCWNPALLWRLLAWLIRNADDRTLTVTRSQARLAAELSASDRHVRNAIAFWREHGVITVVEHGGGPKRKPAKYRMDLDALDAFASRESARLASLPEQTPEVHTVPELPARTPEVHRVPELPAATSGVHPELRKFEATSAENSGSPAFPPLQRYESEKKETEEIKPPVLSAPNAETRDPEAFDPKSVPGLDLTAWAEWFTYKQQSKNPMGPISMRKAARALAGMGANQQGAVDHSIAGGYQNLYAKPNAGLSLADKITWRPTE